MSCRVTGSQCCNVKKAKVGSGLVHRVWFTGMQVAGSIFETPEGGLTMNNPVRSAGT